jgi:hypothetical protein
MRELSAAVTRPFNGLHQKLVVQKLIWATSDLMGGDGDEKLALASFALLSKFHQGSPAAP